MSQLPAEEKSKWRSVLVAALAAVLVAVLEALSGGRGPCGEAVRAVLRLFDW